MIALFDSGYGGLTVLKPIMELLPQYDYLYLGDNARSPYGGHSAETIKTFSEQAVDYLFEQGATLIIFACSTASAVALRHIQNKYNDRKVLGVLIPVAEKVAELGGTVGVVGTKATIESKAYENEIKKLSPATKIHTKAAPLLVPFIEEGWHEKPEAISILKKYLLPLKSSNLDSLILGCTHYPIMHKHFKRILGKKVEILESGNITAASLKDYLQRHPEIEEKLEKNGKKSYVTTDSPEKMQNFAETHLGMKISKPEKVNLN